MDNHSVLGIAAFLKETAERVAFGVGKMLFLQKGIAEGQSSGDAIFLRQRQSRLWRAGLRADAATAPDAICGCAIEGTDLAPIVEVFSVLAEKRQKCSIKIMEFKKTWKMVVGSALLWAYLFGDSSHFIHPIINVYSICACQTGYEKWRLAR